MLTKLMAKMAGLAKGRKGQGMTEYAVVVALVVAIAIAVLQTDTTLSTAITGVFTRISDALGGV